VRQSIDSTSEESGLLDAFQQTRPSKNFIISFVDIPAFLSRPACLNVADSCRREADKAIWWVNRLLRVKCDQILSNRGINPGEAIRMCLDRATLIQIPRRTSPLSTKRTQAENRLTSDEYLGTEKAAVLD
jgi:hypothetical protein